jgi:tRNA1Val (adenine37-N6)-methyltransferase
MMPNNYFEFKRFRVEQGGAAMKVGTDGVLLGAWARLEGMERRILDIGTGTGLIALMAAQRCPQAHIDAPEIDRQAARQARENAEHSPWPERIQIYHVALQEFVPEDGPYDHILCNPPFFTGSLKAPDTARSTARHNDVLPFDDLAAAVARLLAPRGRFSVIYPTEEAVVFQEFANGHGLYPVRRLRVRSTPSGAFFRTLTEYSRRPPISVQEEGLTIELAPLRHTAEYIALTRDFYLKF